jgi:uncharacterized protein (DUF302 family)
MRLLSSIGLGFVLIALAAVDGFSQAETVTLKSTAPFARVADALEKAIADQKMGLVCRANAQAGAAARGVKIAGNQVFMIFRNDFAVRMLAASRDAGLEAPIRIYLSENSDGTATLTYRRPSAIFKPYGTPELDRLAAELDPIFEKIVAQALAAR